MLANKRRRLTGKQPAPEFADELDGATHLERTLIKTLVRDHWVGTQMRVRGLSGHDIRNRLRREFTHLSLEAKAAQLREVTVPRHLTKAVADLRSGWEVQKPLEADEPCVLNYKGKGTMFRWSGNWSLVHNNTASTGSIDDLCVALREHPFVRGLWDDFQQFFGGLQKKLRFERWSIALELHCEVTQRTGIPSVHIHCMFDTSRTVWFSSTDLKFKGCCPHVSGEGPKGRGRSSRKSFDCGHYYLQVPKKGQVFSETNYRAFCAFNIAPDWISCLWQTNKISSTTASQEYLRAKKHVKAYLDNVDYHSKCERELAIAERKQAAMKALLPLQKKAIHLEVVETLFLSQFQRPMFRRKFLVLTGPSCLGKTIYASSLSSDISKTLVVDCGSAEQPDLRQLDPLFHETIVFDECRAWTVVNNRKIFQGTTEEP